MKNYFVQNLEPLRKERKPHKDIVFDTLSSYDENARNIIMYLLSKTPVKMRTFLDSDDLMSRIVYELVVADWLWDSTKNCSKHSYRLKRVRWAIPTIFRALNRKKNKSFENLYTAKGELRYFATKDSSVKEVDVKDLIENSGLTQEEKECIHEHYFENRFFINIAARKHKHLDTIKKRHRDALEKLRLAVS